MSNSSAPDPSLPHNDAGPTVLGVSWSLAGLATIFLGLRLYCKAISSRRLFLDDWILIAAWLTLIADVSITTDMVENYDVGKHSWDLRPNIDFVKFCTITNSRASIIISCLAWSKTAFAVMLLRLTEGWTKSLVIFVAITINVTMGVSALMPWIPWTFLWHLQMQKKEKLGVAICMSFGLIAGSVAIVKCIALPQLFTDDFYNQVQLFYWDATEASITIMAACVPALRVLLRDAKSSAGGSYQISEPNSTFRATRPRTCNSETAPISDEAAPWGPGARGGTFEMENKSSKSESSVA